MSLTSTERETVRHGVAVYLSRLRQSFALDKLGLREAIDAIDDWIDANQAAFNNSLPAQAQTALTAQQKVMLFVAVLLAQMDIELLNEIFNRR